MRLLILLPVFLFAATTSAGPISRENNLVVTKDFYIAENVKYTSQHEIVSLTVPLNKINFDDDEDDSGDEGTHVTVFFVEADRNNANGDLEYKGLSLVKDGNATKVLDNGRSSAAFNDDSQIVYIGATDGIYIYNAADNTTTKYGTLTDNVVQIEADNQTGIVYFLTDHQLFSVSDEGTKKNKVQNVENVVEFAIDLSSNIFYYDTSKDIHVINQNGSKKFEITPKPNEINLVRPIFTLDEGTYAVIDDAVYFLYSNGTMESSDITVQEKPSAYAPEATLLQYYAHDKKIYEYNVLEILLGAILSELRDFLNDQSNQISSLATKSRRTFGA